jgi:hypothetical protein
MECPVCYEVIAACESTRTPCGHIYHQRCMSSWLERATTCPSCRTVVAEAPTTPVADPFEELDERYRLLCERIAAIKARLEAVTDDISAFHSARVNAQKARRSAAAKRGAITRAANRAARLMSCNE